MKEQISYYSRKDIQKAMLFNLKNTETIAKYQNNKAAISKWNYDSGLVYYFSDFEVESGANFQNEVKNLTFTSNYTWFRFNSTGTNFTQVITNSTLNFNASAFVNFKH